MRLRTLTDWLHLRPRTIRCRALNKGLGSALGRIRLEQLEDRSVPATFTWIGANNGDWNLGTNWDQGVAPTAGADVVINNGSNVVYNTTVEINTLNVAANSGLTTNGGTLTVDADSTWDGAVTITGGTVNVGDAATDVVTASSLNLSGTLGGSGAVLITSALNWSGNGTMSGSGTTTVANGATLTMTANNTFLNARTLVNNGAAFLSGAGSLSFAGGAVFDNNGAFTTTGGFSYATGTGGGVFINDGSFTRIGSGSTTTFNPTFTNNGTVEVQTGTLQIVGGGTSTAAAFAVDSGSNLEFRNGYSVDGASSIAGDGSVQFTSSSTITIDGSYSITGATTIANTTNFNTPTTFPTLNLSGTLGGSGAVLITSALNWSGNGTMSGSGTTTVANGATLTMTANNTFLNARTLVNNGAAFLSGAGSLSFAGGAVFDNNGAFTTTGGFSYATGTGGGVFINDGSFTRIGSGSTTTFNPTFTNNGTVEVQTGTLSFNGTLTNLSNGTLTGGTWIVRADSILNLPTIVTANQASVVFDGANSVSPQFVSIEVNDPAGSLTIQNGRNFTTASGITNAGTVTVATGSTLANLTGHYTQTGGITTVEGTLRLANLADIQGGTLAGNGTVQGNVASSGIVSPGTPSSGILTITGRYIQTASGTLNIAIGGLAAGVLFGQLAVGGDIDLDGTLNVSLANGFAPLTGDNFRIIDRTGTAGDNGSFAGLAEGVILDLDDSRLHVTYAGGTGDDVVLTAINLAPTIDAIPDAAPIPMNSGQQTVNLSGIGAGGADAQTLTVTAVSSNPGLIPNPTVNYSSPDETGSLFYTPAAGETGTAIITVTVRDNGGTANGGSDTTTRTFTVVVAAPVATSTTITAANPTPSAFGEEVTFTATVTPGEGNILPTGTLIFKDGDTVLGTSTNLVAINDVATATFVTSATQLGIGTHAITAVYAGNDLFVGSTSAELTQSVSQAQTTTAFTNDTPATSVRGGAVTLSVTVAGVAGVLPSGTVTFHDGAAILGQSNLAVVGGVATATLVVPAGQLALGTHSITASYSGDTNFAASTSTAFTHTVNPLTALPDTYFAKRNHALKIPVLTGLLANDLNAGGHVKLVTHPAVGWLFKNANGSFKYIPPLGFVGKVTFKYRIVNGFGVSAPVVVTIKVKPPSFFV